eukprot:4695906-Amphidinium_carterae.2
MSQRFSKMQFYGRSPDIPSRQATNADACIHHKHGDRTPDGGHTGDWQWRRAAVPGSFKGLKTPKAFKDGPTPIPSSQSRGEISNEHQESDHSK